VVKPTVAGDAEPRTSVTEPTPPTPRQDRSPRRNLIAGVALAYVAIAGILTGIAAVAIDLPGAAPTLAYPGSSVLGGWCRYDCTWYVDIAQRGYYYTPGKQSSVAFFPGYPLAVRAVDSVVGSPIISTALVTWVAGLAAAMLFALWTMGRFEARVAGWAVAAFVLYPYGFFLFGAGYGDALFIALVLAAFLLVEHDQLVLAGVAGALAGVTRPIGVAVVVGLVLIVLERRGGLPRRSGTTGALARLGVPARIDVSRFRLRDAGVLLALVGPVAWSVWLADRFGDAFAYVTVQQAWDQTEGPHTWFKVGFGGQLLRGPDTGYVVGLVIQAILTLVALLAVPAIARRLGAGYAGYTAVVVVFAALGTKDFQGMGRYILAAFPLFALVGVLIADRPRVRLAVVGACGALLALGAFGFARNWYLT
jgi:hypothetical protein